LFYGCYDIAMTPSARNWGERNLVLNTPIIRWFCDSFAGAFDRRDPDLSPLLADLARLPRLLLSVGTLDPLLDDTLFLYSRALAAGNRTELALYAGGIHAFNAFPIPLAREANARADRFLIETAMDEA
jgi:acetyl esterase/lipase